MSDTDNIDNGLPPKLNLSKKTAKPIAKPTLKPITPSPAPGAGAPADPPDTSRIKLAAKPIAKPAGGAKPTPAVISKPNPASAPATVRLKARPRPLSGVKPTIATSTAATVGAAPANPGALKPKSVKLKASPAVGIRRDGVDPSAPVGSKRSTSKIPLSNANSVNPLNSSSVNTKTIKIKPSSDIKSLSGKVPLTINQATGANVPDPKRQTSRISLESALGSDSEQQSTGPKTIRLKRPGKSPTVKVNNLDDGDGKELSKTSKIEVPNEDSGVPATQKKTIKVKRPTQRRSAKTISVKRQDKGSDADATAATGTNGIPIAPLSSLTPVQAPDTAHWTFIFSSVAATIIACVLIYVLCAQVFGPNISLTQLAYGAPTVELPWPGRVY